ncbi:MAG: hypothetical protein P8L84_00660 [Methylococcaceae bacterium]|jgi:hypothetical protein|nr:hypothetical protein [Methylococcaceae bacterium]
MATKTLPDFKSITAILGSVQDILINKVLKQLLETPLISSIFIVDFAILLFLRPPFLFSLVMLGTLVGIAMYFGQKLALFK